MRGVIFTHAPTQDKKAQASITLPKIIQVGVIGGTMLDEIVPPVTSSSSFQSVELNGQGVNVGKELKIIRSMDSNRDSFNTIVCSFIPEDQSVDLITLDEQ